MRAYIRLSALAAAAIILSSCGSPAPNGISTADRPISKTSANTPAPGGSPSPDDAASAAPVPAAYSQAPWYAERLEALGFYVFPAPEPLPPIAVRTLSGVMFSSESLSGKVVLLNFWATWCPPCRLEMPSIQALYQKTRDVPFDIMAISVAETKATVEGFLKNNPSFTYPTYLDESGTVSSPFAGRGIPTTFILDKQGNAIAGIVGSRMYDGPEVVGIIRELAQRLP